MPSQVFAGGAQQNQATANAWSPGSGLTFFASLLSGTGTPNLNPDNVTLADFLAANPTRSLLTDAKNQQLSGLFTQWESASERFAYYSTGQVVFPAPAAGQDVVGVVLHETNDAVPANSTIWAFYDETNGQTAGGNVVWGVAGNNLRFINDSDPANAFSGWGLASITHDAANGWNAASIGYSLVRDTSPAWSPNQLYLSDANLTYITNFAPGDTATPVLSGVSTRDSRYEAASDSLFHEIATGANVVFDNTQLPAGETVIAVIVYEWTGNTANSRILKYHPIIPYLIPGGVNIRYGNTAAADENEIAIPI